MIIFFTRPHFLLLLFYNMHKGKISLSFLFTFQPEQCFFCVSVPFCCKFPEGIIIAWFKFMVCSLDTAFVRLMENSRKIDNSWADFSLSHYFSFFNILLLLFFSSSFLWQWSEKKGKMWMTMMGRGSIAIVMSKSQGTRHNCTRKRDFYLSLIFMWM